VPSLKWIIILSISTIAMVISVYLYIRSVAEDRSSTAAIAYILVPVLAPLVFVATLSVLYSMASIKDIITGEISMFSLPSLFSGLVILFLAFTIWIMYSISRLSKPNVSSEELEKAYQKYSHSFSLIRAIAEGYILENPNVPFTVLEKEVQNGNYNAARHSNLSTESIDTLVKKKSLTDWGMLSNLASNPNIGEGTLRYLAEKTADAFKNPKEWKDYCSYVLSVVATNDKLDVNIRNNLAKYKD
jgi:hypothetical protein